MRNLFLLAAFVSIAANINAQEEVSKVITGTNPIITDQFTADPTARVFEGKVYMYPSHDIPSVITHTDGSAWFSMPDYHVFSSEDLTTWTDHGVILRQEDVPWGKPDAYAMWAPDCVFKDGKYYFYFPDAPASGFGFGIGVAVADRPFGPFTPQAEPIKGIFGIDPCVLIDDDGTSYIYWSGMGLRGCRLNENMLELDGEPQQLDTPLPEGFKEGPFAFKHNGKYYLTYPWVRENTETLAYAMSDNPLGPFEYKGLIMKESPVGCWTNHHSLVEYDGQWYLFYHHNDYSPDFDKNRSARIDRIFFNEDGTIQEVIPTLRGVGPIKANSKIQIDRYSSIEGASIDYLDSSDYFKGWKTVFSGVGDAVCFNAVDFGNEAPSDIVMRVKAPKGGKLALTAGKIAKFDIPACAEWTEVTLPMPFKVTGMQDIKVGLLSKKAVEIDWISFPGLGYPALEPYFTFQNSQAAQPDELGFIRRWLLLEPINKPNYTNTVFVDSYIRENLDTGWNKGDFAVPADGDMVKVGPEVLTWHALDSKLFNVKVYRFAVGTGTGRYGLICRAVTVIDVPEDMENVRLAVGSNSASMWWIDGQEALILSGDRRMVMDDAASKRLTLKKGRHVITGAVINGPGMSDFCVRFIDEQGNPVLGYQILK